MVFARVTSGRLCLGSSCVAGNFSTEEELCDINANFDSSETVVDVITGQIIRGAV
jgi:hypothetical protein